MVSAINALRYSTEGDFAIRYNLGRTSKTGYSTLKKEFPHFITFSGYLEATAEGIHHLLLFTAAPATLAEISRVLKITDGVIRHLAVKRVKGGQTNAPAPVAAVSATADDADGTAE